MIKVKFNPIEITPKFIVAILLLLFSFYGVYFVPHLDATSHARIFDLMFLVASYFFSSSAGSTKKDETIANMAISGNQNPIVEKSENTTINTTKQDGSSTESQNNQGV